MRINVYSSPFRSPLEVAGDIVVKLHVPYSATSTVVQINPNIQGYQEGSGKAPVQIKQLMITTPTDETLTLAFDLHGIRKHRAVVAGTSYDIELLSIDDEVIQNVPAKCFAFEVTRI
jgi:hypothetical protein